VSSVGPPVLLGSRWRRVRARRAVQRGVAELAARVQQPDVTTWRVQPIVEVCSAGHYAAWRKARERAWRADGGEWSTRHWPDRLIPGELAAILLPQSHGGHYRGQPAEIATPVFSRSLPVTGRDVDELYDPLVLGLLAGWMRLALNDAGRAHGALLAAPLVDLIGRSPRPRVPRELGIDWPLPPSEPHIRPARRH